MAYFGLSHPWIAKLNTETGAYSNGFKCGSAVGTSVSPTYNEASLFADNQEKEKVTEFKNAAVTLEVDKLPAAASEIMFGHVVNEQGEEISRTEDSGNYVGYGFTVSEMNSGSKKYRACVLLKVKFNEGEESYETKGDSIAFKTPKLSGSAMGTTEGNWRIKSPAFDTEDEADQWIREKLNISEQTPADPEQHPENQGETEEQTTENQGNTEEQTTTNEENEDYIE